MTLVDGAVILVMAAGFVHGMIKGAILELTAAVAIVAGVFVAGKVAASGLGVVDKLSHPTAGKIFLFVVAFIVVAIVVSIIGKTISNLVRKSALSSVERFAGGVIGVCIVGLVVGLIFKLMAMGGVENSAVAQSELVRKLMGAVSYLASFLSGGSDATTAALITCCLARRRLDEP